METTPPLPAAVVAAAGGGRAPLVLARAPGRVNLIGEHTDYNGLPVLPMAIDRTVWVAARTRDDGRFLATNLDRAFAPCDFPWEAVIPPGPPGHWENYLKAALQAVVRHLPPDRRSGASLTVASDLPTAAGLSSSSALVVAMTLAVLAAHGSAVERRVLADELAAAERYVGVLSGGMDQAAILLAEAGAALRIDFFPLRTRPVPLPPACAVIVADSGVRAEKSGDARTAYNRRVVECRLACRVLSAALGLPLERLGDLVSHARGRPLAGFVDALAERLPDRPATLPEIAAAGDVPVATMRALTTGDDGRSLAIGGDPDTFRPLARGRHVLGEADRVAAAVAALGTGDLGAFGRLMRASHASCRDDYEVSIPALDELVAIAEDAGALGARVTGAGFGGSIVALARAADADRIVAALDARYYRARRGGAAGPPPRFVLGPAAGASVRSVAAP
ncbi:MAG: galactokinase [Deltaproteobacteria bacterium]|nr:galactokinase [Deltaproteobacteria bacterium]